jgi:hypothetical protein
VALSVESAMGVAIAHWKSYHGRPPSKLKLVSSIITSSHSVIAWIGNDTSNYEGVIIF